MRSARVSEFGMHEQGGLVELLTKHYATQIIPNSGPNCFRWYTREMILQSLSVGGVWLCVHCFARLRFAAPSAPKIFSVSFQIAFSRTRNASSAFVYNLWHTFRWHLCSLFYRTAVCSSRQNVEGIWREPERRQPSPRVQRCGCVCGGLQQPENQLWYSDNHFLEDRFAEKSDTFSAESFRRKRLFLFNFVMNFLMSFLMNFGMTFLMIFVMNLSMDVLMDFWMSFSLMIFFLDLFDRFLNDLFTDVS